MTENTAQKEKWVVTGVAGFLGSHVAEQLLDGGHQVLGIDNMSWGKSESLAPFKNHRQFIFEEEDIRDVEKLKNIFSGFAPDRVIHLAALHFIPDAIKYPSTAVSINIHGSQCVLEASRFASVKSFFFASTGDVYAASEEPHHEVSEVKPFNIYGLTKHLGEQLVHLESSEDPARKYVIGRLFNLIGPRETNPHILPVIFEQLKKTPYKLSLGNIFPLRDFVPVTEAAKAVIEITRANTDSFNIYNLATGKACSVADIIELLGNILGKKIDVTIDPARVRKVERNVLSSDISKLKKVLGWAPTADLREEMKALLTQEGLL